MFDFCSFNNNNEIDWNHTWQVDWLDLSLFELNSFSFDLHHVGKNGETLCGSLHNFLSKCLDPKGIEYECSMPFGNRNSFGTVIHDIWRIFHLICFCYDEPDESEHCEHKTHCATIANMNNCTKLSLFELILMLCTKCRSFLLNEKKIEIYMFKWETLNPKRRNKCKTLVCTIYENEGCSNKFGSITAETKWNWTN